MPPAAEPLLLPDDAPKRQPFQEWRVIVMLLGVSFSSSFGTSLVAPILPSRLADTGTSQVWSGIMFAMFPLATLLATPAVKSASRRYGRIPLLFVGMVLQSLSNFTFGYADDLTGGLGAQPHAALAVFVCSRVVCGVGASLANVAIFAEAVECFGQDSERDRLGEVSGWNQVSIGVGFSLGPFLGNFMYISGGFKCPFTVCAVVLLAFSPFAFMLRQRPPSEVGHRAESGKEMGLLEILQPGLLIPGGCVFLGTCCFGLVQPVLSLYLQSVGVPAGGVGPIFGAYSGIYGLSSPLAGMAADRHGASTVCAEGTIASGLVLALVLGPAASLLQSGTTLRIAYEVAGLMLLGLAQACCLIPTLSAMRQGVGNDASRPGAEDCISAWFVIFMNLGLAVGPLVGAAIVGSIGFEKAMLICGVAIAAYGAIAVSMGRSRAHLRRVCTPVNRRWRVGTEGRVI